MKKILLFFIGVVLSVCIFAQDRGDRKAEKQIDKYYFKATDNYFFHKYDSAIEKLEILDFLYEDNSNLKFFLGMCYFFKGDFEKAIEYYSNAILYNDIIYTLDYQNGKYAPHVIYFYMGFSKEKIGDVEGAIKSYEKYIELEREVNIIYNTKERIKTLKLIYGIE